MIGLKETAYLSAQFAAERIAAIRRTVADYLADKPNRMKVSRGISSIMVEKKDFEAAVAYVEEATRNVFATPPIQRRKPKVEELLSMAGVARQDVNALLTDVREGFVAMAVGEARARYAGGVAALGALLKDAVIEDFSTQGVRACLGKLEILSKGTGPTSAQVILLGGGSGPWSELHKLVRAEWTPPPKPAVYSFGFHVGAQHPNRVPITCDIEINVLHVSLPSLL